MSLLQFWRLERDAFIYALNCSKEGREALNDAWLSEQTQPDRAALRALVREMKGGQ